MVRTKPLKKKKGNHDAYRNTVSQKDWKRSLLLAEWKRKNKIGNWEKRYPPYRGVNRTERTGRAIKSGSITNETFTIEIYGGCG